MRLLACFGLFLVACGGSSGEAGDASADVVYGKKTFAMDAGSSADPFVIDCDAGAAPSTTYPAAHPAMPLIASSGGPVLAHPRFVPIIYTGDDRAADIGAFTKVVGTSTYWTSIASDYGVGAATAIDPIVLTEVAPTLIADSDIAAWLRDKLDGTHADFGAPDSSTIYTIYYPSTTTITTGWGTSCAIGSFGGYHSETKIGSMPIVYAVIARCSGSFSLTSLVSHELFEASTDPLFYSAPAFNHMSDGSNGSTEIGDLCEGNAEVVPTDVGFPVQRIWSNAAQKAGHWPCAPSDSTFFTTVADVDDSRWHLGKPTGTLSIAPGASRTIDLVAFSDGETSGPWSVTVSASWGEIEDKLGLTLCRNTAQNGETIPLTITRGADSIESNQLMITSTLGAVSTVSYVQVGIW